MKNVLFIHIPKNAGTTAIHEIGATRYRNINHIPDTVEGCVTFAHMSYPMLLDAGYVSENFDQSAYKFAFVRNPYDRAVSVWSHLMNRMNRLGTALRDTTFLEYMQTLKENGAFKLGLYNARRWSQANPQVRWTENIELDFIGRFERLTEDMNTVFSDLGLPPRKISHHNAGRGHNRSEYCEESKRIVEEFYAEDFEVFGYPIERLGDSTRRRTV